ncbi:hypothetical protein ACRASX_02220 [Flavobacterium sp. TMP13]|uniref:hypothetical protein n=1 Tax=unclassified Flavobacterium TaxID=196869 RepID=UPI00076C1EF2|nr:hypothetical protein [Flavobacterium sp. TAB 87]KVV14382.1 hypothetical protein AP058_02274 [Flavobacterium sp. TAB 87]
METINKEQTEVLKNLALESFKKIKQDKSRKELYNVSINVEGYLDLLFTIANLIKVSIVTLESDSPYSNHIPDPAFNVQNLLEIALQLLPYEEAKFLDETRRILVLEEDNTI